MAWNTLLGDFNRRYPDEAKTAFGGISVWIPNPLGEPVGKFFLAPSSKKFLEEKGDARLLMQRRMAVCLLGAAVTVPFLGFILILVVGAILQMR
jgi:hypothetical protein